MILQGNLQLDFKGETFNLMVKTFLKHGVYYFFVSDRDRENPLLGGEILELTYADSFCGADKDHNNENKKIPVEIVSAVEKMLLDNKQLWFY